jgi:hypothetical protein
MPKMIPKRLSNSIKRWIAANENFQIDAGNPPDLTWAKAVGLKFKDFIPGYGYKLIIKDWADTDNFNGPSCFTDSVVFTTEELAKRALRLVFIAKADGYCDVDGWPTDTGQDRCHPKL